MTFIELIIMHLYKEIITFILLFQGCVSQGLIVISLCSPKFPQTVAMIMRTAFYCSTFYVATMNM